MKICPPRFASPGGAPMDCAVCAAATVQKKLAARAASTRVVTPQGDMPDSRGPAADLSIGPIVRAPRLWETSRLLSLTMEENMTRQFFALQLAAALAFGMLSAPLAAQEAKSPTEQRQVLRTETQDTIA